MLFFQKCKRPKKLLLAVFFFYAAFGSCGAKASMDFPRQETLEKLRRGDTGFILAMDSSRVQNLAQLDPSVPFYAGLLVESAGDKLRSALLFEAALGSPVPKVKSESIRKLVPLMAELKDREQAERILSFIAKDKAPAWEFASLRGASLYVLGRFRELQTFFETPNPDPEKPGRAGGPAASVISKEPAEELDSWNRAFVFLSKIRQQRPGLITLEELRPFLFDSSVNAAYRWAYEEILRNGEYVLPSAAKNAAAGRLAVSGKAYTEALVHFDSARSLELSLFFRHPFLLADLGRAYASSAASKREAGYKLFTDWESAIRTGKNSPIPSRERLDAAEQNALRYNLLFYAGRIRRQQGKHGEGRDLFTRALSLAPDPVQEDACIWYILSSAFAEKPGTVPALIKTYGGRWHEDDEFYDILDRLSCYLVSEKKWNDLGDVFSVIRAGRDGSIIARYAYIMGRAVSLGYVPGQDMNARDYFTIAYEEGNASFYYRSLAASYLNRTVVPAVRRNQNAGRANFPHKDELEFFVKFFEFGASAYAMPYVRENAGRYTNGEMRTLAGTFAASGRYLESIQITGMYMRRDNYVMETADLELYYPKPFTPLIEKNARDNGLHPSLYFGLIRTESAFVPDIVSHAGAVGLAQIMPATGREIAAIIKKRGGADYAAGGNIDLTNPEINALFGAVYLKDLTGRMGSPMLALLAYNCGPTRVRRFREALPSLPEDLFIETINITETRNYGKRVMAAAAAYGYLYYGMSMHEVVASIFK